jgi:hypothetical protein
VLPEVFRKAAGLRLPELQFIIEDHQELAKVQYIDSVLIEVLDDLVNPLMRERDPQLPVQFRKFARAEELVARRGNFGWTGSDQVLSSSPRKVKPWNSLKFER